MTREERLAGLLLGTAVGDALGLPREGLSRGRARRLFGGSPLRHRLLFGHGLVSDDTEHACLVGQALLAAPDDVTRFARALAWRMRGWLLCLPAGVGSATLRATLRLWVGLSPERSGVHSAGNGPAMRAPLLGACLAHDAARLEVYVRASTRLTHRDELAEEGALLVAQAAAHAVTHAPGDVRAPQVLAWLRERAVHPRWREVLGALALPLEQGTPVAEVAGLLGLGGGVTGFVLHTVPMALYAWLRHPGDFRRAVEEVILLGGDTDTTAAITGALAGAGAGERGIPPEWLSGLLEWPRGVAWMRGLAGRLAQQFPGEGSPASPGPLALFWPALPVRGALMMLIVLAHGFRRLLPPY